MTSGSSKHEEWVAPCGQVFAEYAEMVQHGLSHTEHRQCLDWARWSVAEGTGTRPVGTKARKHGMSEAVRAALKGPKGNG